MSEPIDTPDGPAKAPRERLGPVDGDPVTTSPDLEALTDSERALREAVIREFKAKKVRKYVEKQVDYINTNERVAEGIKFLFDEKGMPPANAPMEDIIDERRHIEYQIKWFDAMLTELQSRLVKVKEIEDLALDLLSQMPDE